MEKNVDRLINELKAYEGGGILPQPQGGRRVPVITDLRIFRNQSVVGGAVLSIGWLQESLEKNDRCQVEIYYGSGMNLLSSSQNPRDLSIDQNNLTLYQAPIVVNNSPIEVLISSSIIIPVTITVATRHSSGVLSSFEFQPTVSTMINPL